MKVPASMFAILKSKQGGVTQTVCLEDALFLHLDEFIAKFVNDSPSLKFVCRCQASVLGRPWRV